MLTVKRPSTTTLLRILIGGLLLYTLWLTALYFAQDALLFPGWAMGNKGGAGPGDPDVQQLWIEVQPGVRVEAWFKPGAGRSAAQPGPAVIFFHGNADLIDWSGPALFRSYVPAGTSVLACEFRGYGRSGGRPSERALVADAVRFYDWLAARPEVDRDAIAIYGSSLGGGVAIALAAERPARAVVVESTFASIVEMTGRYLAPPGLLRHPFRSDERIRRIACPILVVHGRHDTTIPIEHGRRLARAARNARLIETDSGHNGNRSAWGAIWEFLRSQGIITDGS